ncbi:MAG: hypothetical protein OYL92_15780 [Acidobacteriota bacterium]|nr:hypothetical protein [Acidobacteriota bacterium]MDE3266428.1 hypothetical protein [Acidobacteriota bacterium]
MSVPKTPKEVAQHEGSDDLARVLGAVIDLHDNPPEGLWTGVYGSNVVRQLTELDSERIHDAYVSLCDRRLASWEVHREFAPSGSVREGWIRPTYEGRQLLARLIEEGVQEARLTARAMSIGRRIWRGVVSLNAAFKEVWQLLALIVALLSLALWFLSK